MDEITTIESPRSFLELLSRLGTRGRLTRRCGLGERQSGKQQTDCNDDGDTNQGMRSAGHLEQP
jgi:hypothetical protein